MQIISTRSVHAHAQDDASGVINPPDLSHAAIVTVDDDPTTTYLTTEVLSAEGYTRVFAVNDSAAAIAAIQRHDADLVLLDVHMPGMTGLQVLDQLRRLESTRRTPVIMLTSSEEHETRVEALDLGATDFLRKPVEPVELCARVRNALSLKVYQDQLRRQTTDLEHAVRQRTDELTRTRMEVVHCLARAAEHRDNETGRHVLRVGRYAGLIARAMQLPVDLAELIELAAPLHDVGKIGIPDGILLKPGKLNPDEYEVMRRHAGLGKRVFEAMSDDERRRYMAHTDIGARIIGEAQFSLLQMAGRIALTHHERYDGKGYPLGLAGDDIPIEGRITTVADVFDALTSARPYKPAFSREKCFAIMLEERGKQFDPTVLDAFLSCREAIIAVQVEYADVA